MRQNGNHDRGTMFFWVGWMGFTYTLVAAIQGPLKASTTAYATLITLSVLALIEWISAITNEDQG
jgi:ammonia channel protein AmtB